MRSIIAAAVVALASTPAFADSPIDESKAFSSGGRLEVANTSGDITVTGWDRDQIEITGTLWDGAERLEFEVDGDRAWVEVIVPRRAHNIEASTLNIRVPRQTELEVSAVSADIIVIELHGEQRLATVSGNVETTAWNGDVRASTVSGDVDVDGHGREGYFSLSSTSGDVTLHDAGGDIRAGTVSGEVRVRGLNIGRAELETTSGDIDFEGRLESGAELDIGLVSGGVDVELSGVVNADFDIETFSGSIRNSFGPRPEHEEYGPGEWLDFTEGDGSAQVRIRTLSGRINLRRR